MKVILVGGHIGLESHWFGVILVPAYIISYLTYIGSDLHLFGVTLAWGHIGSGSNWFGAHCNWFGVTLDQSHRLTLAMPLTIAESECFSMSES